MPSTVLPVDRIHRLLQLPDILGSQGIQGLLHHRPLGASLASKGEARKSIVNVFIPPDEFSPPRRILGL
jgi:hypothetical protein